MTEVFRRMTDEEVANSDTMIVAQCAASVYGGKRRCRNRSRWSPQSMLLDADGNWFCAFHRGYAPFKESEDLP
jgi:hypothetical protein